MIYLVKLASKVNPSCTTRIELKADSAWHAGWLSRQLHPERKVVSIEVAEGD